MRWWNSFNILAVLLVLIALSGLLGGGRMVFDPGRTPSGREWMVYLVAGGLMLLNGLLPPATPLPAKNAKATTPAGGVPESKLESQPQA